MSLLLGPAIVVVAGCGGHVSAFGPDSANLSIHADATHLDTNGTTRLSATLASGDPANVQWKLTGGDPNAGVGSINAEGVYTPPAYLTRDSVSVQVEATATGATSAANTSAASLALTVTPGFLQPLSPGNLSVGANGSVTVSGSIAEVGGNGGIHFSLATDPTGTPSTEGSLSAPVCRREAVDGTNPAYTVCSVTYTAPASVAASHAVYLLGSAGSGKPSSWTRILLNAAGINSDPAAHQARQFLPVPMGSSAGSNADYDSNGGKLTDCCGGTLGALLQDASGNQYVLSNNHVFARSDQAIPGETVIQPGLIDNGCTPYGIGPGTTPVATLTGYPALSSAQTNVDAAIARVSPGLVDSKGNVLELGTRQQDGTLAAAPPGISSTNGQGEKASLGMMVAKSGRTTGLTCAPVSAVNVDVLVDYFTDCAETTRSMTKRFTDQIAVSGTGFSDAGDSGALVVDSSNAEPVGLFFAGGTDVHGVEQAIANPASEVLSALDHQVSGTNGPTSYSYIGGQDHSVTCVSYDTNRNSPEAGTIALTANEQEKAETAMPLAQLLINPSAGIERVGIGQSKDHLGTAVILFYVNPPVYQAAVANGLSPIPASVRSVTTGVLPVSALNPDANASTSVTIQPRAGSFASALAEKEKIAASILKTGSAIFGIGVGQSLDNPADAALVVFIDRNQFDGTLPEALEATGQRVRLVLMDRLHVTRAHGTPLSGGSACPVFHRTESGINGFDPWRETSSPFSEVAPDEN
ncbi:S1 family peptidase [Acidicapsa dinghuensis]|uniref:S1 family peptidase n=1 Tax=Acidicapsa dinghuensis TaxID=2218256 RepID=UPI0021E008CC|nr:S1 family peptidase [Acidicapsa dinghuensis]